jgi:hypothetical protein
MRELAMVYLCGVLLLLLVSTSIGSEEEVHIGHILIAAFGWPILAPVVAVKAWTNR